MAHLLRIKGMVCERCIQAVHHVLHDLRLAANSVTLGELEIADTDDTALSRLHQRLSALGFSVIRDEQQVLSEAVKALVSEVYSGEFVFPHRFRFSAYASEKLGVPYETLASAFAAAEPISLDEYITITRMEKVKQWLLTTPHSLEHIAFVLGFSGRAHLAARFKSYTGITTAAFRQRA